MFFATYLELQDEDQTTNDTCQTNNFLSYFPWVFFWDSYLPTTMMIRLTKATLVSLVVATFASYHVGATGFFGRPSKIASSPSSWGRRIRHEWSTQATTRATLLSPRALANEIRGGSTTAEEEVTVAAEQLYLPGLLETSVVRSNTVRHYPFSQSSFVSRIVIPRTNKHNYAIWN